MRAIGNSWRRNLHAVGEITEERVGGRRVLRLKYLAKPDNSLETCRSLILWYVKILSAVQFGEAIEGASIGKTLECLLIYRALVIAFDEFEYAQERSMFLSLFDDAFYGRFTNSFQSSEAEANLTATVHCESFQRFVDVGTKYL